MGWWNVALAGGSIGIAIAALVAILTMTRQQQPEAPQHVHHDSGDQPGGLRSLRGEPVRRRRDPAFWERYAADGMTKMCAACTQKAANSGFVHDGKKCVERALLLVLHSNPLNLTGFVW